MELLLIVPNKITISISEFLKLKSTYNCFKNYTNYDLQHYH